MQTASNPYQLRFEQEDFIRTGVVDIQQYLSSPVKVMLILKGFIPSGTVASENAWKQYSAGVSGRANLQKTVQRLGLVCWALRYGFRSWIEVVEKAVPSQMAQQLNSIAYVSIPKFSDSTVYRKIAIKRKYKKLTSVLNEHIASCEPDIVIFCGTFELFKENLEGCAEAIQPEMKSSFALVQKRVFINATDPEIRFSDLRYYEHIKAAIETLHFSGLEFNQSPFYCA